MVILLISQSITLRAKFIDSLSDIYAYDRRGDRFVVFATKGQNIVYFELDTGLTSTTTLRYKAYGNLNISAETQGVGFYKDSSGYLLGFGEYPPYGDSAKANIIKFDTAGNILWAKIYNR